MKTLLDLTGEFAALNEAKTRYGKALPPGCEKRWAELKAFYDALMAQNGISNRPGARRFTAVDIRLMVTARMRLRVPAEMDVFLQYLGDYHTARLINLSCGGVLLAADTLFEVGSRLTLYLTTAGRKSEPMLASEGEVVWRAERRMALREIRHRMGIRFIDLAGPVLQELESFVVETLEQQLSALDARCFDPDFLRREHLVL